MTGRSPVGVTVQYSGGVFRAVAGQAYGSNGLVQLDEAGAWKIYDRLRTGDRVYVFGTTQYTD